MGSVLDQKLDKLRKKKLGLDAQIRRVEARQKTTERKRQTRQKILLGALLMSWMEQDNAVRSRVKEALPNFLTRRVDRQAFGLGQAVEDEVITRDVTD